MLYIPDELAVIVFLLPDTKVETLVPDTVPPEEEKTVPVILPELAVGGARVVAEAVFDCRELFPDPSLAMT